MELERCAMGQEQTSDNKVSTCATSGMHQQWESAQMLRIRCEGGDYSVQSKPRRL